MKLSLNWIKSYVSLPEELDPQTIAHDLTMSTVEVEGVFPVAERFKGIVVGVVTEILPHPDADKLVICRTDVGDGELKEIVCGGTNLRPGMSVAVALPGSLVRWHGQGEPVEIKRSKVRGVTSYGMICASSELGLEELLPAEERVIMDLSDFSAVAGCDLASALGIDDVLLEVDNKSLTNRPDLWGHYGIARELSAIYDAPLLQLPAAVLPQESGGLKVDVLDAERCPRCTATRISGVTAKEASFAMRAQLWLVGQRPLGALVDITNYVMLAIGQPTHAYDTDNLKDGTIIVRRAAAGEKLLLLNGRDLTLRADDLVIADSDKAVGLAGIMGGERDSIAETTVDVTLEAAAFHPLGTRRTATHFGLRTEASIRYEKGIDPQRIDLALSLALQLFQDEFPTMRVSGHVDCYPAPLEQRQITVSLNWLERRMGIRLPNDEILRILGRLGFESEITGDSLHTTPPTWRSTGDVSIPDDIMEEVARMYGYDNFEPVPIATTFSAAINQRGPDLERRIREYLSFRCGLQEIFTYPWMKDEYLEALGIDCTNCLTIATPPAPDESKVRSTLLPGITRACAENLRFKDAFMIYELTQVFNNSCYSSLYDEREALPATERRLTAALVGRESAAAELFLQAKGILEWLPRFTHSEPLSFARGEEGPSWADDAAWLDIMAGTSRIGSLGLLSKKASGAAGIRSASVVLFEICVDGIEPLASRDNSFAPIPEFPQVEYDISLLFDEMVSWSDIKKVAAAKGALTRDVSFVDEYRGKQVPEGKKSITLRLLFGANDRTLTSEEIEHAAGKITERLAKQLGGEVRKG